jgi:hypothetical protein
MSWKEHCKGAQRELQIIFEASILFTCGYGRLDKVEPWLVSVYEACKKDV